MSAGNDTGIHNNNNPKEKKDIRFKMVPKTILKIVLILLCILAVYEALKKDNNKIHFPIKNLFSNNSGIQEISDGHLEILRKIIDSSELTLVYFYAPWCAESHHYKDIYETVSQINTNVKFSAINCWNPGSQCRLNFGNIRFWPFITAFYSSKLSIQYKGSWNVADINKFIRRVQNPIIRLTNIKQIENLSNNGAAVAVGLFNLQTLRLYLPLFYQSALRWMERYTQNIQFAIVTGNTTKLFNNSTNTFLKLYLWNETIVYTPEKNQFSIEEIILWLQRNVHFLIPSLSLTGKKSTKFARNLVDKPAILLFTTKNSPEYYNYIKMSKIYKLCYNQNTSQCYSRLLENNIKDFSANSSIQFRCEQRYNDFTRDKWLNNHNSSHFLCAFNSSLSFFIVDTEIHEKYLEHLIGDQKIGKKSQLLIVDTKYDTIYRMKTNISLESLFSYTNDYHSGLAKRYLKSEKKAIKTSFSKSKIYIKDINSKEFKKLIIHRTSAAVLLYYSTHCYLCTLFSQVLLITAKILSSLKIDFYRIDGDKNDLPWNYSFDIFPTLILFPENKTDNTFVYPNFMKVNTESLLGFILVHINLQNRLKGLIAVCEFTQKNKTNFKDCLKTLRKELLKTIENYLSKYSKYQENLIWQLASIQKLYWLTYTAEHTADLQPLMSVIVDLNLE